MIKNTNENKKLINTLKKINKFALTHSQMETMAKVLTSLNSKIVGFPFKIEMEIQYCSTMIIKPLSNPRAGFAFRIYMGSDYIEVIEEKKLGSGCFINKPIEL